jgi:uncharacterized protein (TIGR04222 family)
MRAEHAELWRRIESFSFDEGTPILTFEQRLARENGWPIAYTRRVLNEYKRFVFLTMTAGHPVCPSEQVDQAWHLHLTYTRSYWERFCRGVLGRPLHHDPMRGGYNEREKHNLMYSATLASYREVFGDSPPADIWPDAEVRFSRDIYHQQVNTKLNWIIPKRWVGRAAAVLLGVPALLAATLAAKPLLGQIANPWNFDGPQFLKLYWLLAVLAVTAALTVRWWLKQTDDDGMTNPADLDASDVALLCHGKRMAINAGIAALVQGGQLELVTNRVGIWIFKMNTYELRRIGDPTADMPALNRAILESIPGGETVKISDVHEKLQATGDAEEWRLQERGLLFKPEPRFLVRVVPMAILLVLAIFGVSKIYVGLSRGKPVEYLILSCAATGVAGLLFLAGARRTAAGDRAAKYWKHQASTNGWKAQATENLLPAQLAMAIAVLGIAAIPATAYGGLRDALNAAASTGGGGGGCGSGCGGGGCGGGGCGGCG